MSKKEIRRAIKIEFENGQSSYIEIDKVSEINLSNTKEFVYLDKNVNGKWRLAFTKGMIPEFTRVKSLNIIRDDDVKSLISAHLRDNITNN